jgi:hypothetical protein
MNLQGIKKRIAKILVYSITSLIFLLVYSFLILQIPSVQKLLAKQVLGNFSEITDFRSTFDRMRFSWFDRLVLYNVKIEDPEHNEMIAVQRLVVNYKIKMLLSGNDVNLDAVELDSARIFFKRIKEGDSTNLNINVFVHQINEHYGGESKSGSSKIHIGEAIINRSRFAFDNTGKDSLSGFDYNHFAIKLSAAEIQNFIVQSDSVEFNVNNFNAIDSKTNFTVHQLTTFFRISNSGMEFRNLNLNAGQSTITDTILFKFDTPDALEDFNNQVRITANLNNTIIYPEDLAHFAPEATQLKLPITISGKIQGRINNFRLTNMDLQTGSTRLQGSISMDGLPDFNETFIVLKLNDSELLLNDIDFLFNEATNARLQALGALRLNAEFVGYPTDFVAKGNFTNNLGRIISDINLKIDEKSIEHSTYRGQLSMIDFNLGEYFNDTTTFQKVNLKGQITGKGFTASTASFKLVSIINSIGIKGYNYTNIKTDATFESQFFNGSIQINDPAIQIQAKGSIDLRNNQNLIKVVAQVDTLQMDKINFSKKKLFVHGLVDINMKGFELDSLLGKASIKNLSLNYDNEVIHLDSLSLIAEKNHTQRALTFYSDFANIKAEGNFYFSRLFTDINQSVNEFIINLKNNKSEIEEYYTKKIITDDKYEAHFDIELKNIKPLTRLFKIDLKIGKNITIDAHYLRNKNSILKVYSKIDSLMFDNILLQKVELEINASKFLSNSDALVMAYLSSPKQQIGTFKTKNLVTETIWNREHLDFYINLEQETRNNFMKLEGSVDFLDSTQIILESTSKVQLLEKIWTIDPTNKIAGRANEWGIHHFKWRNDNQSVNLNGHISNDASKDLKLTIENFNLTTLNSITERELTGIVNAQVMVTNLYKQITLQNKLDIQALTVDKFLIGNITGDNVWDNDGKKFMIKFLIDRLNSRIVDCTGYYNPSDKKSPLNITANLVKANLKIIEPFLDDLFTNMGGTISGTYYVTGSLNSPQLNGKGKINDGQLTVDYLKTAYEITGNLGLTPTSIYFENIELTDIGKNKARLSGEIIHNNFSQMRLKLDAVFERFNLLNTTARDNNLFYGQIFATGDVNFSGPVANLRITANASTDRNTRISIPIGSSSSTSENKEYINFINFSDSTIQTGEVVDLSKKINLTGVTLDLNIDVNPNAYCEIIFDIKAGDIIHGRGNGKIKLQLDTKGEFNMFGPVVFTEGGYNFTLYDLINKEFSIESGSSIAWYGDPYQGILKINATYNQLASLGPIFPDPTQAASPQLRRKYPVQVLLKLDGPMLSPTIDFDIRGKDLPKSVTLADGTLVRLDDQFQAYKSKLDEQELKRQVFSLIILRKFSPLESFNTSGSIVSSVSELFTNQLSYWINQVDENLEIDVDLGTMDKESFNAFQLRLSYSFLGGRLRITRDGTFGNQATNTNTTEGNRADFSSVAGDWTVDYLLTADGKFRVKMYSRSNVNPINNTLNSQSTITTGVSLLHTQSFNELRDLLKFSRDKNRRKQDEEEPADLDEDQNEGSK